jgi:hypothetical protein
MSHLIVFPRFFAPSKKLNLNPDRLVTSSEQCPDSPMLISSANCLIAPDTGASCPARLDYIPIMPDEKPRVFKDYDAEGEKEKKK